MTDSKTNNVTAKIDWKNPNPDSSLKAVASVTLNNGFVVHGMKLKKGKTGLFVAMPSRIATDKETGEKRWVDVAHPIHSAMRMDIHNAIVEAYNQAESMSEDSAQTTEIPKTEDDSMPEEVQEESEETDEVSEDTGPIMNLA